MFRDILVPLDGSRFAEAALPLAGHLARATEARLHLVLAQVPQAALMVGAEMVPPLTDSSEERKALSHSYLAKIASRLRVGASGSAEFSQVDGPAGPSICEEATRLDADLVVMATHGRGAFRRFWLGGVADYVIRHLATPVLLVHPTATQSPRRGRPIRGVLVALDLSPDSEAILDPAIQMAKATGAALTLVHVNQLTFTVGQPSVPGQVLADAELLERSRLAAEERLHHLAAQLRQAGLKVAVRVISETQAAPGLLEALEADEFDLIAMTTQGRRGLQRLLLGSVAERVIRGSTKPVLVLRPLPAAG